MHTNSVEKCMNNVRLMSTLPRKGSMPCLAQLFGVEHGIYVILDHRNCLLSLSAY